MTFDRIRVISKGNKHSIEFIFSRSNLLIRLIYQKTGSLNKSVVNDGKLAYTPKDEQDFINCIAKLSINKELNDYLIEKYYTKSLSKDDIAPSLLISLSQLIKIASKKYNIPEYQINRLTAICSAKRDELVK